MRCVSKRSDENTSFPEQFAHFRRVWLHVSEQGCEELAFSVWAFAKVDIPLLDSILSKIQY